MVYIQTVFCKQQDHNQNMYSSRLKHLRACYSLLTPLILLALNFRCLTDIVKSFGATVPCL